MQVMMVMCRCISDLGKESRLPFLDETVVSLLNSLPIEEKVQMNSSLLSLTLRQMDLRMPRGLGEKLVCDIKVI